MATETHAKTNKAHFVVWLMKEDGIHHSWTKLMIILHVIQDSLRIINHVEHLFDPLCISKNGVVMLKSTVPKVVSYNSTDRRLNYSMM
ncbi:F-box/kelch-repeat protein [Spatholobus suberectus]|nr:F-box/kelch-repeat protein [Spatholobus suberectus]